MDESALGKVLRLAAASVHTYQRRSASGRVTTVRQYQQNRANGMGRPGGGRGLRLGAPYRSAWGNLASGDVVEFGSELWRVVPSSSVPPGQAGKTSSGTSANSSTGAATGGSTTGVKSGASTSSGTGSQTKGSSTGVGGVNVSTLYMQDVRNPKTFDKLALPINYVVTVVPVLPLSDYRTS